MFSCSELPEPDRLRKSDPLGVGDFSEHDAADEKFGKPKESLRLR
jgi:hypothetical protein